MGAEDAGSAAVSTFERCLGTALPDSYHETAALPFESNYPALRCRIIGGADLFRQRVKVLTIEVVAIINTTPTVPPALRKGQLVSC